MVSESSPARSRALRVQRVFACLLFLTPFVLSGCGGERVPPLTPVKGKVTVDGAQLIAGQVTLVADPPPATPLPTPAGKIGPDGSYQIFTGGKAGAPLGKFKVRVTTLTMSPEPGKEPIAFDKKYSDPEASGLTFDVIASPESGRYDLKLTK